MKAALQFGRVVLAAAAFGLPVATAHAAAYSIDGSQIEVSVAPEKPEIVLGEESWLVFRVEKRSGPNFVFARGITENPTNTWPREYLVEAEAADGTAAPRVKRFGDGGSFTGSQASQAPIVVGSQAPYEHRLLISTWVVFDRPGEYTMKVWRRIQLGPGPGKSSSPHVTVLATVKVRVVAPPPAPEFTKGWIVPQPGDAPAPSDLAIVRRGNGVIVRYDAAPEDFAKLRNERGVESLMFVPGAGKVTYLSERDLVAIEGWSDLKTIELGPIPFTDATLAHLAKLPKLESLPRSNGHWVSKSALDVIAGMKGLKRLELSGFDVDDTNISKVRGLTDLEVLDLQNTQVTAAGVANPTSATGRR